MTGARLGALPESTTGRGFRVVPFCRLGELVAEPTCSWAGLGPEFSSWASRRSTTRAIGSGWAPGADFGMSQIVALGLRASRHLLYRPEALSCKQALRERLALKFQVCSA